MYSSRHICEWMLADLLQIMRIQAEVEGQQSGQQQQVAA